MTKLRNPWPELKITATMNLVFTKMGLQASPIGEFQSSLFRKIHPGYSLKGKGGLRERTACFQISKNRIVLPAFGSFTGLKNIPLRKDEQIFLTNGEKVIGLPSQQCFILNK